MNLRNESIRTQGWLTTVHTGCTAIYKARDAFIHSRGKFIETRVRFPRIFISLVGRFSTTPINVTEQLRFYSSCATKINRNANRHGQTIRESFRIRAYRFGVRASRIVLTSELRKISTDSWHLSFLATMFPACITGKNQLQISSYG